MNSISTSMNIYSQNQVRNQENNKMPVSAKEIATSAALLGTAAMQYGGINEMGDVFVGSTDCAKMACSCFREPTVKAYEEQIKSLTEQQTQAYLDGDFEAGDKLEEKIQRIQDKIYSIKHPDDTEIKILNAQREECFALMNQALEAGNTELYEQYHTLWLEAGNAVKERRQEMEDSKKNNQGFIERIVGKVCDIIPDSIKAIFHLKSPKPAPQGT